MITTAHLRIKNRARRIRSWGLDPVELVRLQVQAVTQVMGNRQPIIWATVKPWEMVICFDAGYTLVELVSEITANMAIHLPHHAPPYLSGRVLKPGEAHAKRVRRES